MVETPSAVCGQVLSNSPVAQGHFLMRLRLPRAFATPSPGQFVMLREAGRTEPLLARPLSVCGFERTRTHAVLEVLYRVAGRGTGLLARKTPGEEMTVLGPLGRGFTVPGGTRKALFVAGGVGVAPLMFLLHSRFKAAAGNAVPEAVFYFGARAAELVAGRERLAGHCDLKLCTDDGSLGYCGTVTDLLGRDLDAVDARDTIVYACGPGPMLLALSQLLAGTSIACQVSLEERMACGLGACLGCAVAVRGQDGRVGYRRVCREGPVFDLREVILPASRLT